MAENKKEPSLDFKRNLIGLYFKRLGDLESLLNSIGGFEAQGFNMESFYWMDPSLNPTEEDLKQILSIPEYSLRKDEITEYLSAYRNFVTQTATKR